MLSMPFEKHLKILAHPVFTGLNFHMPMVVDLSHPLIMLKGEKSIASIIKLRGQVQIEVEGSKIYQNGKSTQMNISGVEYTTIEQEHRMNIATAFSATVSSHPQYRNTTAIRAQLKFDSWIKLIPARTALAPHFTNQDMQSVTLGTVGWNVE